MLLFKNSYIGILMDGILRSVKSLPFHLDNLHEGNNSVTLVVVPLRVFSLGEAISHAW